MYLLISPHVSLGGTMTPTKQRRVASHFFISSPIKNADPIISHNIISLTMSIGAASLGMSVRSPSNKMSDVELGSSSHGGGPRRALKSKESDIGNEEMAPLMISGGDGKLPQSPRGASSTEAVAGERSSCMKSLIASAMYSGCSVGMVLVNKSLASR